MKKLAKSMTARIFNEHSAVVMNAYLFLILSLSACNSNESSFRGTTLDTPIPATDFTLTAQDGQRFTLSQHRGEIILLFFGYAYCPDVCPLTLSTWKQVQDALRDEPERVKFAFVTVDPERDTVEQLQKHLSIYSTDFYGLTGTTEELQPVYDSFGVFREKVTISTSATGYLMNHTSRIFVIEGSGEWRLSYPFDAKAEDIVHDVRQLLKAASKGPQIRAENIWSRPMHAEPAANSKDQDLVETHPTSTGVVYLTLVNDGDEPDRLITARSEVAEAAEIHETTIQNNRMMMAPVSNGVEIPANGERRLEPGGIHIMLVGLRQSLLPGDQFEVILDFEKSGSKIVASKVRSP